MSSAGTDSKTSYTSSSTPSELSAVATPPLEVQCYECNNEFMLTGPDSVMLWDDGVLRFMCKGCEKERLKHSSRLCADQFAWQASVRVRNKAAVGKDEKTKWKRADRTYEEKPKD